MLFYMSCALSSLQAISVIVIVVYTGIGHSFDPGACNAIATLKTTYHPLLYPEEQAVVPRW